MKLIIASLLVSVAASSQSTITTSGPISARIGEQVAVSVNAQAVGTSVHPAAVGVAIIYPPTLTLSNITPVLGQAAIMQSLSCSPPGTLVGSTLRVLTCVIWGLTPIPDGELLRLTATATGPVSSGVPIEIRQMTMASATPLQDIPITNLPVAIGLEILAPLNRCDVTGDNLVTSADTAMMVSQLLAGMTTGATFAPVVDVNRDGRLTLLDLLIVFRAQGGTCGL